MKYIIAITFLFSMTAAAADWSDDAEVATLKAVVFNNIKGCGEIYQKEKPNGDLILKCSRDGSEYFYYVLSPGSGLIAGPYPPEYVKYFESSD